MKSAAEHIVSVVLALVGRPGRGRTDHEAMTMHEHVWRTLSRHLTGDGDLSYQFCRCGQWRLLLGSDQILATPKRRVGGRHA